MTQTLSRRSFLKLSSGAAAAVGLSTIPGTLGALSNNQKALRGSATFVPSVCEMCTSGCTIEARVEDGKGVFIRGNPNDRSRGGTVCARGGAGFNQLYDPQRLVKPIMRVGERGEGKWKEVSWDEAYTFIAKKLDEIKQKHGAHTVAWTARSGWTKMWFHHLAQAYGSHNIYGHEATCPLAYQMASNDVFGSSATDMDWANSKYVITMGHNVFGLHLARARGLMQSMEKGAKLIAIEPRLSVLAAKADEWHAIKPGHDLPFVLAFMHVLINENLCDMRFIEQNCTGFEELKAAVAEYTPEKMASECDISADTIKRLAREFAAAAPHCFFSPGHRNNYTPQELELRRAQYMVNALVGAVDTTGGIRINKNAGFYNKLLGEDDPKAPTLSRPKTPAYPPRPSVPRLDRLDQPDSEFFLASYGAGIGTLVPKAAINELPGIPYKIHGWIIARNNPVMTMTNTETVIEGMKKMDLVVVCDIQVSDTAWYADVVLPDTTYLERDEALVAGGGHNPNYGIGRQKVVEPLGDSKPNWMIAKELANKMGLGEYFPWRDIEDYRLQQVGNNLDLLAELKLKGMKGFGTPLRMQDKKSVANFVKRFPGAAKHVNSDGYIDLPTKVKLYSPKLQEITGVGGLYYEPFKYKEADELYFINGKNATRTNGHTGNNEWMNDLMSEADAWIHPNTAKKLGIKTGDEIELYNKYSTQRGKALVTEGIREDSVFVYMGFGHVSKDMKRAYGKGINSNYLYPSFTSPRSGMDLHVVGVKVRKV